mmetsp:Transcript_17953/g.49800  ORF Transcript_17953/g.49800 Transcript_17953/m.49800 type:complete len:213 (-) Transcript_17953:347-985(-)
MVGVALVVHHPEARVEQYAVHLAFAHAGAAVAVDVGGWSEVLVDVTDHGNKCLCSVAQRRRHPRLHTRQTMLESEDCAVVHRGEPQQGGRSACQPLILLQQPQHRVVQRVRLACEVGCLGGAVLDVTLAVAIVVAQRAHATCLDVEEQRHVVHDASGDHREDQIEELALDGHCQRLKVLLLQKEVLVVIVLAFEFHVAHDVIVVPRSLDFFR